MDEPTTDPVADVTEPEPELGLEPELALAADLFGIYQAAGRSVSHFDRRGTKRPYWAHRFRQAVQSAVAAGTVVEYVEHLMGTAQPSRGFLYLRDAGRLDLTVEALVADESRSYHDLFTPEAVNQAMERLAKHSDIGPPAAPENAPAAMPQPPIPGVTLDMTFDVRISIEEDGAVRLTVIDQPSWLPQS